MYRLPSLVLIFALCGALALPAQRPLRILTYNVKMLPRIAFTIGHKPVERAHLIPTELMEDSIDVVCFQEVFDRRSRKIMERELRQYYPYMVRPCRDNYCKLKGGSGVMFMSRYPMNPIEKIRYSRCKSIDCLAHKGAVIVEVSTPQMTFQILGTHTQSGGGNGIKIQEQNEVHDLLNKYASAGKPQIVMGDFNTYQDDTLLYPRLLATTGAVNGPIAGDAPITFDMCNDMVARYEHTPGIIDYILYRGNGVTPRAVQRSVRPYRHAWGKSHIDLSDHYAMLMELQF